MSDGSAEQKNSNAPARTPRGASTFAIIFCAVVVGCWIGVERLLHRETTPELLPLANAEAAVPYKPLPPNSPVLNIADGANLAAPFVLREESSAAGGSALFMPKGSRNKARNGRAALTLNVPSDGTYHAWARVRWSDSCSNSITMKIGDGEERTVGEDALYNAWHWVSAGKHALKSGPVLVTLIEREDNLLLDQLVFTCDAEYVPTGMITVAGETRGIRRFADDFSRSPGHGIGEWNIDDAARWQISFSFDPNRIPNQYALVGTAKQDALTAAMIKSAPWHGCRLSFSFFPQDAGEYGAILERRADGSDALQISFEVSDGKALVKASGTAVKASADLKDAMRLRQWHEVVVERWAWVTRVLVDGKVVLRSFDGAPRAGDAGLFVKSGSAVFDDVEAEEIPWQADDGRDLTIAWKVSDGGSWFRAGGAAPGAVPASSTGSGTLTGRSGSISTSLAGMPVAEIFVAEELKENLEGKGMTAVDARDLNEEVRESAGILLTRLFSRPAVTLEAVNTAATLRVQGNIARIQRVAVRYGLPVEKRYTIGPFHFTEPRIEDASDYLDFTREEYEAMAKSPDAEKLRRQAKFKPVVGGANSDNSPWNRESGNWGVSGGVLRGYGPGAILRLAEETGGDLELTMRVRLFDARSSVEVEFDGGREPGVRVAFAAGDAPKREPAPALSLPVARPGEWQELHVRLSESEVAAGIGKEPLQTAKLTRKDGRRFFLKVLSGSAEFDDVQLTMPRKTATSSFASFQQREAEWWREGNWIDHAGIACVQASSWVSLIASDSNGMLWNKREFGPDAAIAFGVEENTEWYGWDKPHSHDHFPFDNICAVLGTKDDRDSGYRLEINAENRKATVLYRNGKPVARTNQNQQFPIIYVGGHAPFAPRTNHVQLVKRGNLIRGVINAREIIRFEDPEPLDVKRAGVGGYKTRINFSQIDVRTVR